MSISAGTVSVALQANTTQFSRAMANAAKQLAHDIPSAAKRASMAIEKVGSGSKFSAYKAKELGSGASGAASGLTSMGTAAAVAAGAFVALNAAQRGFDLAKMSSQFADARTVFTAAGNDINEFRAATKGLLSDKALVTKFNYASQLGVSKDAFMTLANVADAAAKKMGVSQEYAFDSIITGSVRMSKPILDNAAIMVDAEKVNKDYAASIGKVADDLTEAEQKQAFLNEVVKQGNKMIADVAGVGATASDVYDQWDASTENLSTNFGLLLDQLGKTTGVVPTLTKLVTELSDVFDGLANGTDSGSQGVKNISKAIAATLIDVYSGSIVASGIDKALGTNIHSLTVGGVTKGMLGGGSAVEAEAEAMIALRQEIEKFEEMKESAKSQPFFDSRDAAAVRGYEKHLTELRAELGRVEVAGKAAVAATSFDFEADREPGTARHGFPILPDLKDVEKIEEERKKLRLRNLRSIYDEEKRLMQEAEDIRNQARAAAVLRGSTGDIVDDEVAFGAAMAAALDVSGAEGILEEVKRDFEMMREAAHQAAMWEEYSLEQTRMRAAHETELVAMQEENRRQEQAANAAMAGGLADSAMGGAGFAAAGSMAGGSLGAMASMAMGDPSGLIGGAIGGAAGGGLGAMVDALPSALGAGMKLLEIVAKLVAPFDRLFAPLQTFAEVLSVAVDRSLVPFLERWAFWAGSGIELFMRLGTTLIPLIDLLFQLSLPVMILNASFPLIANGLIAMNDAMEKWTVSVFSFANEIITFMNSTFGTNMKTYDIDALTGAACFTADTPVRTPGGFVRIADLAVGDTVCTSSGEHVVSDVHDRVVVGIVLVLVRGAVIETTSEHPFWVVGRGWTKAGEMAAGDLLIDDCNNAVPIDDVTIDATREARVFNLTVHGPHTYYVGNGGGSFMLVHNKEAQKEALKAARAARDLADSSNDAADGLSRLTESTLNTPTGFRVEQYRYDAQNTGGERNIDASPGGMIEVHGDLVVNTPSDIVADELVDIVFGEAQTRAAQQLGNPLAEYAITGRPRGRRRRR